MSPQSQTTLDSEPRTKTRVLSLLIDVLDEELPDRTAWPNAVAWLNTHIQALINEGEIVLDHAC